MNENKMKICHSGLLDFKLQVSDVFASYYLNPRKSDVTLVVEGERIPAHRFVLAAESEYFEKILYDDEQQEVEFDGAPAEFHLVLQYMYCKVVNLREPSLKVLLNALKLSRQFGLRTFENGLVGFLMAILTPENALAVLPVASHLNIPELLEDIFALIEKHEERVYDTENFLTLNASEVSSVVSQKRKLTEVDAFKRVSKWLKVNPDVPAEERCSVLSCIDIEKMTGDEITTVVKPSKLVEYALLREVLRTKGIEMKFERFPTTRDIDYVEVDSNGALNNCIVFELEEESFVNHVRLKCLATDGYDVELSLDKVTWTKVVHYSGYSCRDEQFLYFRDTLSKFIRLGSRFRLNHLASFVAFNCPNSPRMVDGFVCPSTVTEVHAEVYPRGLPPVVPFWTKFVNEGAETGFVQRPFILFKQPYMVNTIHMRLWDFDGRVQTFKITIRTKDGTEVVHDSKEPADGWQLIKFPAKAITTVHVDFNEAGEEVRVAYLEVTFTED